MMRRLYDPLVKREENFLTMNWESAELTKYAANTHARGTHQLHERDDDPVRALRRGHRRHPQGHRHATAESARHSSAPAAATADRASPRTSPRWSTSRARPDTKTFSSTRFRRSTRTRRSASSTRSSDKLGRPIDGSKIAVWGLAFKADTDDIRESPAIDVIGYLLDSGATVRAHDYKGMENMKADLQGAGGVVQRSRRRPPPAPTRSRC